MLVTHKQQARIRYAAGVIKGKHLSRMHPSRKVKEVQAHQYGDILIYYLFVHVHLFRIDSTVG